MTDLTLENLTKRYPGMDEPAVNDVSVTAPAGGLLCLLGPSGCGKTTTLKMIAGLEEPDAGRVCFGGRDVTNVRPEHRDAVLVFQNYLLFPFMSVEENVGFGLRMRGLAKQETRHRVARMLETVRLEGLEQRKPEELSGGQKQRVALARALVLEPGVLLLDEPFSNLDAYLRDEMRELILKLKADMDLTIVFVTHDQEEAVQLGDRIALMFDGRVRQVGEAADFFERPASMQIAAFFGNRNVLRGVKNGSRVRTAVGELEVENARRVDDGPVRVLVRPEFVELCSADGAAAVQSNSVAVELRRATYMGTHVRYRVALDSTEWDVHAPPPRDPSDRPGGGGSVSLGSELTVRLPPERIWLLPVGED